MTQIETCALTYSPLSLNECIHMSRQELNMWMNFFCTSDLEWCKFQLINLRGSLFKEGSIGREEAYLLNTQGFSTMPKINYKEIVASCKSENIFRERYKEMIKEHTYE